MNKEGKFLFWGKEKKTRKLFGKNESVKEKKLIKKKKMIELNKKAKKLHEEIERKHSKKEVVRAEKILRRALIRKKVSKKQRSIEEKTNMPKEISKKLKIGKNNIKMNNSGGEIFLKTGVKGFDALFEKNFGIPKGAAILVEGGPGSGKTIFCLTTLANLCKQGKKGLFMSFEEAEERLIDHMEGFGWPAKEFIKKGLLRVKRFDAIDVSRSVEALLSAAKKELLIEVDPVLFPRDFQPDFIVIDSLTSIASAFSGHESRFRVYMEQLFRYLEKNNITNFLIREVSSPSHVGTSFKEQGEAVSFLSDGIVVIYNVIYDTGQRDAAIEVLKMRGANFKKKIVRLEIKTGKGIIVFPNQIVSKKKGVGFELT